jgi:hypothetical protein
MTQKTRWVEYLRCWSDHTWDTDTIEIPADTPQEKLNDAVREAASSIDWSDAPPLLVGYYAACESLDRGRGTDDVCPPPYEDCSCGLPEENPPESLPETADQPETKDADAGDRQVTVHLLAFGQPGEQRIVSLPLVGRSWDVLTLLNAVFHFGQNDVQPQPRPSVSVGDVIEHEGHHYLVCGIGFHRFPDPAAWMAYRALDRAQRIRTALLQRPTVLPPS